METNAEVVSKIQEEVDDDLIASEILSRLPVKSLMRFKCVSKHWHSIIHNDRFFIDLHLSRSTRRHSISFLLVGEPTYDDDKMYLLSAELLLPSNEENGCAEVGNIVQWEPPIPIDHDVYACTLNGLICFMDTTTSCARVYNCSTRESTPWIKSLIKQHEDKNVAEITFQESDFSRMLRKKCWSGKEKELSFVKHDFGYDPVTKEHKVIASWELRWYGGPPPGRTVYFWEVMTVGQNSWRRINGIDPSISPWEITCSVYLNGSIYLLCKHMNNGFFAKSIIEFSVGSEKFRLVETLARYAFYRDMGATELIQVNGRLCVLTYNFTRPEKTCTVINMRILYDLDETVQHKKRNMTTISSTTMSSNKSTCSSNYQWVEQTMVVPRHTKLNCIRHVPGTELFIIQSPEGGFFFNHYNQKNRTYSISKIDREISTTLKYDDGELRYSLELFDSFTPNLLPVNRVVVAGCRPIFHILWYS